MTTPPIILSGTNDNKLGIAVQFIYDSSISGYRALIPTDFNGASSTGVVGTQGLRTGNGSLFTAQARKLLYVQNLSANVLYIALSGTASPSNHSIVLRGGSSNGDGNGGIFTTDSFYGSVSVSGSSPSYLAWEM